MDTLYILRDSVIKCVGKTATQPCKPAETNRASKSLGCHAEAKRYYRSTWHL